MLLVGLTLISCNKNDAKIIEELGFNKRIGVRKELLFKGTFEVINSRNDTGTIDLKISNGYYECSTNYPYWRGAGKLEVNGNQINFRDTLFFIIPVIYARVGVLSGVHQYKFNGTNLKISRGINVGEIRYKLNLVR